MFWRVPEMKVLLPLLFLYRCSFKNNGDMLEYGSVGRENVWKNLAFKKKKHWPLIWIREGTYWWAIL